MSDLNEIVDLAAAPDSRFSQSPAVDGRSGANKPRSGEPSSATSHRKDRLFGKFRRVIPLAAAINTHKAEARLQGGVLSVRFPKVPNKRGEEVNIPVQNVEE